MNALATIAKHDYMARRHPEYVREDAIHADVALLALVTAAEMGASELIRAGRGDAGRTLLAAVSHFKTPIPDARGILMGNVDLVPAQHAYLTGPGDKS